MGGGASKNAVYEECKGLFTSAELDRIDVIFNTICGGSQSKTRGFNMELFGTYLKGALVQSLHNAMFSFMVKVQCEIQTEKAPPSNSVGKEAFTIGLAQIFRGTIEEKATLFCELAGQASVVTRAALHKVIVDMLESLKIILEHHGSLETWKVAHSPDSMRLFADMLVYEIPGEGSEVAMPDVERWMSRSSLLLKMLDVVMTEAFPIKEEEVFASDCATLFPSTEGVPWEKFTTLLDMAPVLALHDSINSRTRYPWRLVYSSRVQGLSYGTMHKAIRDQGPTVIVVQDSHGHTFGGYASVSWTPNANFYGTSDCFIFQVAPKLQIYPTTSHNQNFMYLNMGQETLPNGLGMGGQFDYFGLWLDNDFGQGHSKAEPHCSTYDSPQLSKEQQFEFSDIEVWAVAPDPKKLKEQQENEGEEVSILDKDAAGTAMLKLLNKGPVSEGLRDKDPMADAPAETEAPQFSDCH